VREECKKHGGVLVRRLTRQPLVPVSTRCGSGEAVVAASTSVAASRVEAAFCSSRCSSNPAAGTALLPFSPTPPPSHYSPIPRCGNAAHRWPRRALVMLLRFRLSTAPDSIKTAVLRVLCRAAQQAVGSHGPVSPGVVSHNHTVSHPAWYLVCCAYSAASGDPTARRRPRCARRRPRVHPLRDARRLIARAGHRASEAAGTGAGRRAGV
jgi:hypothetical protein